VKGRGLSTAVGDEGFAPISGTEDALDTILKQLGAGYRLVDIPSL
jgi:enolase